MARRKVTAFICGGDLRPGPRDTECPNALHDWPLPSGYVDASEVAAHRLSKGWSNRKCTQCGLHGWMPGTHTCDRCAVS